MAEETLKNINLTIPFSSAKEAIIAYEILKVDKDLRGGRVKRNVIINNTELIISFEGTDPKRLRVAISSTFRNVLLILKSLSEFGFG